MYYSMRCIIYKKCFEAKSKFKSRFNKKTNQSLLNYLILIQRFLDFLATCVTKCVKHTQLFIMASTYDSMRY